MPDKIILLRVSGDLVKSLLENSVSAWPVLDGRFACLSGLKFSFDPNLPAGSRVHTVKRLDGQPFDLSREAKYNISAKEYIALGKDGYTAFTDPSVEWLNDSESALSIQDIVFGAFESLGPNYEMNNEKNEARR